MTAKHQTHLYHVDVRWTGNSGQGTVNYQAYERSHEITVVGKPPILSSSDPAFRGDKTKYNPEELFVAALSACHMLWYLHLCAISDIIVTDYVDRAIGTMMETKEHGGRFTGVILKPIVTIEEGNDAVLAEQLHEKAHQLCFIANSVNFSVRCEPSIQIETSI